MHPKCSDLTKKAFNLYRVNSGLVWVCTPCRALLKATISKPSCAPPDTSDLDEVSSDDELHGSASVTTVPCKSKPDAPTVTISATDNRLTVLETKLDCLASQLQEVVSQAKATEAVIKKEVLHLGNSVNGIARRHRNVLLLNAPEDGIVSFKLRRSRDAGIVQSVFRAANLPLGTTWKRVHRIGKWSTVCLSTPRHLLVEFHQQELRDTLLSRKSMVQRALTGNLLVVPDTPKWTSPARALSRCHLGPSPVVKLHRLPPNTCFKNFRAQLRPTDTPVSRAQSSPLWTHKTDTRSYSEVVAGKQPNQCLSIRKAVQTDKAVRRPPRKNGLVPRRTQSRDE